MMRPLVRWAAYLVYVVLHTALPLYSFVRWHLVPLFVRHLAHLLTDGFGEVDLAGVKRVTQALGKVPEHLTFVFDENDSIDSTANLQRISNLICYAIAAGVPYVSVFDSKGLIKERGEELMGMVEGSAFFSGGLTRLKEKQGQKDMQNVSGSKDLFLFRAEQCQHHRHLQQNADSTEVRTFCVKVLCAEDGRTDIINAIRTLCNNRIRPTDINVGSFQKTLTCFQDLPDPSLMLKFDGNSVMPEFPPWQMALTEIFEAGTISEATWPNVFNGLCWYSRSVQRFGK